MHNQPFTLGSGRTIDKIDLLNLLTDYIAKIDHSPTDSQAVLANIAETLDIIFREIQQLRAIVCDCAAAIGNGAYCHQNATVEFMSKVPHEISLRREAMSRALVPLKMAHDAVVTQRREFADPSFIMFESEIDTRVRFTFGHASAILDAAIEPQTSEASVG